MSSPLDSTHEDALRTGWATITPCARCGMPTPAMGLSKLVGHGAVCHRCVDDIFTAAREATA